MAAITASGLGSGLDVNGLVTQLVAAERSAADLRLDRKELVANAQLTAFGAMKSALSTFQSSLSKLTSPTTYQKMKATTSDETVATLTASAGAAVGAYDMEVSQLAKPQSLASGSFDSTLDTVGLGEITFRFGTTDYNSGTDTYNSFSVNAKKSSATITIDATNNTLEGIRDTVNNADIGVRASIVNDGTGYRLLFSSEDSGAANSMEISVSDLEGGDTDNSGLSQLAFNQNATNMSQTVAGQDALLTINGLAVSSPSNEVEGAIQGVTLDLKKTTSGSPVALEVANDEVAVRTAIVGLVEGYNKFMDVVIQHANFNKEDGFGGILQGDATQRTITSQLQQMLTSAVTGISDEFSTLADFGIKTKSDGKLEFDNARLVEVVGEHFDDIAGMFAAVGKPSDTLLKFVGSGDETAVGDYDVEITQLATRGTYSGTGVLPDFAGGSSLVIDADNDTFDIRIDGLLAEGISLTQGTYSSGEELAAELQSKINGASALAQVGTAVTVTYDSVNNRFDIQSDQYGSSSKVEFVTVDTNTAATLGFSVGEGVNGVNVEGTINGVAAKGVGQLLTGADDTDAEGLQIEVLGGALGSRGNVSFTRGIADQLHTLVGQILDADGPLDSRTESINQRLESITNDKARLDRRMEEVEARYRKQFTQLDLLISQATSTQQFLTQQLAALPGAYSGSSDG
ncbi:flagellar filament capping protein FliD [Porticoccaceae bacterium LTM1]|nr:flagellar filament capping protein FliD [Porticoccaceae bacterium LTM1]